MRIVIDASVVVKWVFPESEEEDLEQALSLLAEVKRGRLNPLQPPHWLVEVADRITPLRRWMDILPK
jgi:predicted nucleic acid-binding protein